MHMTDSVRCGLWTEPTKPMRGVFRMLVPRWQNSLTPWREMLQAVCACCNLRLLYEVIRRKNRIKYFKQITCTHLELRLSARFPSYYLDNPNMINTSTNKCT